MEKISCIICAYNEEGRIGGVLEAVKGHPMLNEVIVVDDGSTDNTKQIVDKYASSDPNIRLIVHPANKGKSNAIATGISASKNNLLMFIDADLIGLSADDITRLIEPVLSRVADISVSLRKNSLLVYKLFGFDFFSGERVLPKNLLADKLEEIKKLPGFAIETFINKLIVARKMRIKIVKWKNVISPRKAAKIGFWKGRVADYDMIRQILKTISAYELIKLCYFLTKARL